MIFADQCFDIIGGAFLFALGACIGSFINVVAYRVPLGKSVILPASSCPHCGIFISALGLVPIFGFFFVRGVCAHCKVKISLRYPVVEALTGFLTAFTFFHFFTPSEIFNQIFSNTYGNYPVLGTFKWQVWVELVSALWLLYTGIALSLIDLDHMILPDIITLPGTFVGVVLGALNPSVGWANSLIGVGVGAGSIFFIAKAYEILRHREGLGFGDVRYLGFLGAVLGWQGVIWVIAIASLSGSIVGIGLVLWKKESMTTLAIPYGPFLAFGAFVIAMWGDALSLFLYPAA